MLWQERDTCPFVHTLYSQQLHSSVRAGQPGDMSRLLSPGGAQANFFPPEKGTTPLHVAAKAGQTLQAEAACGIWG